MRWVHAGEVPNIASLLKGGELLLTTGYGLGTRPAEQRAFVRTPRRAGHRGPGGRAGPALHPAARRPRRDGPHGRSAARPTAPRGAVRDGHRGDPHRDRQRPLRAAPAGRGGAPALHARPCSAAAGSPRCCGILADFSGNPVFLETTDGQLLYAAGAGSAGRRPAPGVGGAARPAQGRTPPAGAVLVDVPGGGPGRGFGARPAGPAARVAPRSLPVHRIAAERAAGILAVVLMQARQEEELAARGRGDFLTDLAEGRIAAEDAPAQARVLGFRPGAGPLLPVVMRLGDGISPGGGWAVLARAVAEELASVGVPVLLGVRPVEGRVPVLLGLRSESERPGGRGPGGGGAAGGVERAGMQRPGAQPPVVVVGVAGGWAAASAGLRHAAETATAAQGLPDRPWYDARRLDIDLLLWRLRDHPDLAAFVDRAIGPLRDHDHRSKPPLLPTLETYLAHAGRKAETARELHLNRQTLYNRLARIGELLGTDLDDPQTVLALSLALRARRHVP